MDSGLHNLLQELAWIATAVGAGIATAKYWSESRLSREQRESELRWKQAEAGKSLNDEKLVDKEAWAALSAS